MTPEQRLVADIVRDNPGQFKLCEGCASVIAATMPVCRACHGYRFEPGRDRVLARLAEIEGMADEDRTVPDISLPG